MTTRHYPYIIADNVLSPLGSTTAANFEAVRAGRSSLARYAGRSKRPRVGASAGMDAFVASRFSDDQRQALMVDGLTRFESLVYHSVSEALTHCTIDVASRRTLLVISTTKANVEHLSSPDYERLQPAESAKRIASRLGVTTPPLVVCNACISGVAALVTAQRLLMAGLYDTIIVTGCDIISHFIVSGFQSLKALSPEPCRPFDIDRIGMNLGEAAATIILTNGEGLMVNGEGLMVNGYWLLVSDQWSMVNGQWSMVSGAIRNDAYHTSSPSPKGDGCASAIRYVIDGTDPRSLSAVNAHGTATLFNDQMESVALAATGLSQTPTNSLKGYFGHTLGASGILETIITMHSVASGELPATRGFSESGVSGKMTLSASPMAVSGHSFVKVISGFGGCNAALYCTNTPPTPSPTENVAPTTLRIMHSVEITPSRVTIDGRECPIEGEGADILTWIYKNHIGSYPKFYKMDRLSQLGFVASELLLAQEDPRKGPCTDRAVVLFNHSSSVCADRAFAQTIVPSEDYYPSPSLFVGTLPNIVCGEIAIRHGYHSETSFYIMSEKDESMINKVIQSTFLDKTVHSMVTGWVDYQDDENFEAKVMIIEH